MIIEGQIYSIWLEHAYTHTQYSHMFDLHISSICMFRCCLESYCYLRVSTASSVVFDMCVQCDFCTILIISLVFACVKPPHLACITKSDAFDAQLLQFPLFKSEFINESMAFQSMSSNTKSDDTNIKSQTGCMLLCYFRTVEQWHWLFRELRVFEFIISPAEFSLFIPTRSFLLYGGCLWTLIVRVMCASSR